MIYQRAMRMKLISIFILMLIPIFLTLAQKSVYLRNNENAHLKKIKSKSILTFKISDSTFVTGRIISSTDSLFEISTYSRHEESEIVTIQIKSVSQVTNKLMNRDAVGASIFGYIGIIGLITSPILLLTDTPEDAKSLLEVSAVFIGIAAVLYSPHLIKRNFDTWNEWTLVTK